MLPVRPGLLNAFSRGVRAGRIVFMDNGGIIEEGPPAALLLRPQHERTQAFLEKAL
jgi:ABC-type polar amino acid transport system ATPase subunit